MLDNIEFQLQELDDELTAAMSAADDADLDEVRNQLSYAESSAMIIRALLAELDDTPAPKRKSGKKKPVAKSKR